MTILKKIRHHIVQDGSLKKYLLYGLGEILLVMIGILLALQINKWSQQRTDRQQENHYYRTMSDQLTDDLGALNADMDYNQRFLEQFIYAKEQSRIKDDSKVDTLGKIAFNLLRSSDFRRRSNVYQTLVNTGEIKLITDSEILNILQTLEQTYTYIERLEEIHQNVSVSQMAPLVREMIQLDPFVVKEADRLFSFPFRNNYVLLINLMSEKQDVYNQAKEELQQALDHIKVELLAK